MAGSFTAHRNLFHCVTSGHTSVPQEATRYEICFLYQPRIRAGATSRYVLHVPCHRRVCDILSVACSTYAQAWRGRFAAVGTHISLFCHVYLPIATRGTGPPTVLVHECLAWRLAPLVSLTALLYPWHWWTYCVSARNITTLLDPWHQWTYCVSAPNKGQGQ